MNDPIPTVHVIAHIAASVCKQISKSLPNHIDFMNAYIRKLLAALSIVHTNTLHSYFLMNIIRKATIIVMNQMSFTLLTIWSGASFQFGGGRISVGAGFIPHKTDPKKKTNIFLIQINSI